MSITLNGTTGVTTPGVTGLTTALTAANGGTGLTAPGTSGNLLTSNGTAWVSSAPSGGVTSLNGATGAVVTTSLYSIGASILGRPANNTSYAVDSTIAGSSLYSVSINLAWYNPGGTWNSPSSGGGAQTLINTGSWRCQSPASSDGNWGQPGIWIRYA